MFQRRHPERRRQNEKYILMTSIAAFHRSTGFYNRTVLCLLFLSQYTLIIKKTKFSSYMYVSWLRWQWLHVPWLFWQWLHVSWLFWMRLHVPCLFWQVLHVPCVFWQWLHVPCFFWQRLHVPCLFWQWLHVPCLFWQWLHVPCLFWQWLHVTTVTSWSCLFWQWLHAPYHCLTVTDIILEHILYYATICSAYLGNILLPFGCVLYTYLSTFSIFLAELFFMSHVRGSLL